MHATTRSVGAERARVVQKERGLLAGVLRAPSHRLRYGRARPQSVAVVPKACTDVLTGLAGGC